MRRSRNRHAGHGRLFWRIYLNGLLLLALSAAAIAAVGAAYGGGGATWRPERFAEYAAAQAAPRLSDPAALAEALRHAREVFGAEIAVYRGEGLVASNATPAPPPPSPAERARLDAGGAIRLSGRPHSFAAPVPGAPGTYAVLTASWRPFSFWRAASAVGAVLLALALGSVPLARAIASPLERLTAAARRLGEGDLGARAGAGGGGEVGELARAFDEMAGRLERQVRAERELLANVSHELRTPLARIRVALDLAAEGDLTRARRYLSEIGTDLGELEGLVEDVLTAARLEQGATELPLRREALDVEGLLADAAAHFRDRRPGRRLDIHPEAPFPSVEADPALLRRALANLLDNAAKYSDADAPVALAARARDGRLQIEVRDRGIGVEAADLPRLFTPFFRTDRSRARGTGGIGLGLALVRRIAEAHGGSVAAESTPGEGTTLRLEIPAAGAADPRS